MEVKKRPISNGFKLLSVIERLSFQNGNKLTHKIHKGNGSIVNDDETEDVRGMTNEMDELQPCEESNPTEQKMNYKQQAKKTRIYPYIGGQTVSNAQLTLKPGVPNGVRPTLCFCHPPHGPKKHPASKNRRYIFGSDSGKSVSEEAPRTSVIQYAQCLLGNEQVGDKIDQIKGNTDQIDDRIVGIDDNLGQVKGLNDEKEQEKQNEAIKHATVCGVCLQKFPSVLSWEKHRKENGHYLCSECGEALQDDLKFKEHVTKKLCKTILCVFCGQRFVGRDEVEEHKAKVHHKCLECNKLYKTKEKLSAHNERRHGAPYICLQCGEEFSTHDLCRKHAMTKHTKKYYCPECGKGFSRMNILHRHATYTHSDEKNFKCEVCFKTFKRKDALKIHMISHSDNKPFRCEYCGKGFGQKICLTKHLPCKKRISESQNAADRFIENLDKLSGAGFIEVSEKSVKNPVDEVFLGCRCPPTCACKKFSIGLKTATDHEQKGFRDSTEEIASLPCCCDVGLDVTISD